MNDRDRAIERIIREAHERDHTPNPIDWWTDTRGNPVLDDQHRNRNHRHPQ